MVRKAAELGGPMTAEETKARAAETANNLSPAGDVRATTRTVLRSSGPRLLRDILGPTLCFFGGWRLSGNLAVGVALGSLFSLAAYRYERRHGRPGAIARFVLAFVVVQAVIGLATGSAKAYLVQPVILGGINGLVWLGSVAVGKPLAAVFANEVFPLDERTRTSREFRSVFRHVSLVFGACFLIFAAAQLGVLLAVGVDAFVAARVVDAIGILIVIAYSVRYAVGQLGEMMAITPLSPGGR
jgi:hypothetical protein